MQDDLIKKWLESAEKNKEVAEDMYKLGHFHWSLFMWHLTIEKLLKAILAKNNKEVPYIHDLWKLSNLTDIDYKDLNIGQIELDEITTFNLEARYEDYKFDFYKKVTKEYAEKWIKICLDIYQLLLKEIK